MSYCFPTGTRQQATVFTGVAVSAGPASDVIEVRKQGNGADILVNGALTTIDSTTSQFRSECFLYLSLT